MKICQEVPNKKMLRTSQHQLLCEKLVPKYGSSEVPK